MSESRVFDSRTASADRRAAVRPRTLDGRLLVFILAVGVFGILNTEMGVVGILPQVAEVYGVSITQAGLLVSGFALVVAFAGPTMPLLFSRVNRKTVMLLALGIFSLCNVVSVFAPNFGVLLAARVAPAAFHPLYVSMAMSVGGTVGATPADRAKSVSRVFIGVSAGMVLGVPVASWLASAVSLRASMAFFAVVTLAVLAATVVLVPSMPAEGRMSYGRQLAILKKPVLVVSFLAVLAINGAMFGFYSYLSDFLGTVAGMDAFGVSAMLLVYGGANIVGNVVAGRLLAGNAARAIVVVPVVLVALYAVLFAVGRLTLAAAGVVLVLGIVAGVANTIDQHMVAHAAPEAPDFSNGLYLTAANLGTTLGTTLCGAFIAWGSTRLAVLGAVVFLAAGIALSVARTALVRRGAQG